MTKEDIKYWETFRANKSDKISKKEYQKICEMHARLKNHNYFEPCTCNPKGVQRFIDDINKIYDNR